MLPAETRGLGYGALGSVNGVGDLLSSVIVGLLWSHVSVAAGLAYAAILSVAGALLILRVRRRRGAVDPQNLGDTEDRECSQCGPALP